MTKIKKVSLLISMIIIVVGVVIFATIGFNYNLSYGNGKRIVVPMNDEFAIEDYKNISQEIYGDAKVELISVFKEGVSITVKDTNDEQLDMLVSKVNEKYGYDYTRDELEVLDVSKVEFLDIIKPMIVPMLTTILIILVYMIVRYKKQGLVKIILNLFLPVIIMQLLVLSIYLICRVPLTNMLVPILLIVYAISVMYSVKQLEK